jgi:hypothetical protein
MVAEESAAGRGRIDRETEATMKIRRKTRFRGTALALAASAAIVVPAAAQAYAPGNEIGGGPVTRVVSPSASDYYTPQALKALGQRGEAQARAYLAANAPDALDRYMVANHIGTSAPSTAAVRPDDRAGIRGPGVVQPPVAAPIVSKPGFDWGDAGIGALGGLGAMFLLGGAMALVLTRRSATGRRSHGVSALQS